MHAETLKQFLALLVGLLPTIYTESAFSSHKSIQHELVLVGNPLQVLLFIKTVQTQNLFWSYK